MRNAFIRALTDAAAADERIVFLTGDLGFKLFDDFAARYPGRFMNVGVAEATMAGVAAGLALEGKKPFIYSIVPFATLRCYEQMVVSAGFTIVEGPRPLLIPAGAITVKSRKGFGLPKPFFASSGPGTSS